MTKDVMAAPKTVSLTDAAVSAVERMLAKEGQSGSRLGLRIKVAAGGCAGLRYQLYFEELPPHAIPPDRNDPDLGSNSRSVHNDKDGPGQPGENAITPTGDRVSVVWFGGVAILIDVKSVPYLRGSIVDFADTIEKQGFTIENPNAQGGCSCGSAFR